MKTPIYKFQCMHCFIVSGHMSSHKDSTPRCCGGKRMITIEIKQLPKKAEAHGA